MVFLGPRVKVASTINSRPSTITTSPMVQSLVMMVHSLFEEKQHFMTGPF
jgi:hypothetical protein